jgi:probable FeS assembly SUF system protein SufT
MQTEIITNREVNAVQIPSGDPFVLPAGTAVIITQTLGGSYTVATQSGLARISSDDADALGVDPSDTVGSPAGGDDLPADASAEDRIWNQLKQVFDPEIPVDIVNLGLVYDCSLNEEDGKTTANIKMTLTAPGCGMGPVIAADAQARVMTIDGIDDAHVDLVWDPPWNQDMISEEGRMKLGMV